MGDSDRVCWLTNPSFTINPLGTPRKGHQDSGQSCGDVAQTPRTVTREGTASLQGLDGVGPCERGRGAPGTLQTRASSYCKSLIVLFFDSRTS